MEHPNEAPRVPHESYLKLLRRFLRFGFLAWGGPVAQIALIRQELVEEERWVSREQFNRVLGVYQVLPGPEAHELCCYFGMLSRGRIGAVLAGLGFMLPGLVFMLAMSWWYLNIGAETPLLASFFLGFAPAVAALVVKGGHKIGEHALHDRWLFGIGIAATLMHLFGIHFALVLGMGAIAYPLMRGRASPVMGGAVLLLCASLSVAFVVAKGIPETAPAKALLAAQGPRDQLARSEVQRITPRLGEVGASGLRAGLLTFGGAYTSIPFVEKDAVVEGNWLSRDQFLDGIALAGILPAPLIIFTTFVGYVAGGWLGGLLMTAGVFLPAFSFTLIGHGWFEKILLIPWLHRALDGITAAVVGLIAVTALSLARQALTSPIGAVSFLVALLILYKWKSRFSVPVAVLASGLLALLL